MRVFQLAILLIYCSMSNCCREHETCRDCVSNFGCQYILLKNSTEFCVSISTKKVEKTLGVAKSSLHCSFMNQVKSAMKVQVESQVTSTPIPTSTSKPVALVTTAAPTINGNNNDRVAVISPAFISNFRNATLNPTLSTAPNDENVNECPPTKYVFSSTTIFARINAEHPVDFHERRFMMTQCRVNVLFERSRSNMSEEDCSYFQFNPARKFISTCLRLRSNQTNFHIINHHADSMQLLEDWPMPLTLDYFSQLDDLENCTNIRKETSVEALARHLCRMDMLGKYLDWKMLSSHDYIFYAMNPTKHFPDICKLLIYRRMNCALKRT